MAIDALGFQRPTSIKKIQRGGKRSKYRVPVTLVSELSPLGCLSNLRFDQERSNSRKYLLFADKTTRMQQTFLSRQRLKDK